MGIISLDQLVITPEMLNLIAEIDEFKGAWLQLGRLTPDRLSALKKVATIESIGSSTRIEGAKLSDKEIEGLLSNIEGHSFQTRDEQEVLGYAVVCEHIYSHFETIQLSENVIKHLHLMLLQYTDKDERHKGEYKKIPIRIEAFDATGKAIGILLETTSPLETPFRMQELVIWAQEAIQKKMFHPLITIGVFVVVFLAIHPFQDGNGRLSRLLTTLLMLKSGYQYVPYSSLESIIESNKESYYLALQRTQKSWQNGKPDWNSWLIFFLRCLQRQKRHLETKLENEKLLKKLPELNQKILELLKLHGPLTVKDLTNLTQGNRNTIKKALHLLVKENYIDKIGQGKSTFYSL